MERGYRGLPPPNPKLTRVDIGLIIAVLVLFAWFIYREVKEAGFGWLW